MSEDWQGIAAFLTVAAGLIQIGVTLGALPRFAAELEAHKKAMRDELDKLWEQDKACAHDRRHLSEELLKRTKEARH